MRACATVLHQTCEPIVHPRASSGKGCAGSVCIILHVAPHPQALRCAVSQDLGHLVLCFGTLLQLLHCTHLAGLHTVFPAPQQAGT